jgi:SPP1 family predicted phage head-tail adaptor
MISAGTYRHRLTFQRQTTTQDAIGGASPAWESVVTVWGCVEPLSGRQVLAAKAIRHEITHQIQVRWHPALSDTMSVSAMRILFGSRILLIQFARHVDEKNTAIEIEAKEIR